MTRRRHYPTWSQPSLAFCSQRLLRRLRRPTRKAGHQQEQPKPNAQAAEPAKKPGELPPFIPPVTEETRKAAFPDVEGHAVHDRALNYFVLFDQLEWQATEGAKGVNIDSRGWIGGDRDRLWFRAEGDGEGGRVGEAQTHVLYGRQIARYWDLVGGIRQDFRPGPAQTWAAFGVQGLAPYWFDIEATGYVGAAGRTHARFEVEYELLFTNRLVLQPLFEAELVGKSDPERGVGAGLSTTDLGFRLRYEIKARVCAVSRYHLEQQMGKDRRLRRGRRRRHGRSSIRHWTAAVVLNPDNCGGHDDETPFRNRSRPCRPGAWFRRAAPRARGPRTQGHGNSDDGRRRSRHVERQGRQGRDGQGHERTRRSRPSRR